MIEEANDNDKISCKKGIDFYFDACFLGRKCYNNGYIRRERGICRYASVKVMRISNS
ncbi:hypothetical protein L3BBH23_10670 [Longicatena caecimuris]|nr:hypothetical protein L3BBH23_10670 [Longicatena caecimuris]